MEYPVESDPILASLYCAASCSCSVGAWARASWDEPITAVSANMIRIDAGEVESSAIRWWNFRDIRKTSASAFLRKILIGSSRILSQELGRCFINIEERERPHRALPMLTISETFSCASVRFTNRRRPIRQLPA